MIMALKIERMPRATAMARKRLMFSPNRKRADWGADIDDAFHLFGGKGVDIHGVQERVQPGDQERRDRCFLFSVRDFIQDELPFKLIGPVYDNPASVRTYQVCGRI